MALKKVYEHLENDDHTLKVANLKWPFTQSGQPKVASFGSVTSVISAFSLIIVSTVVLESRVVRKPFLSKKLHINIVFLSFEVNRLRILWLFSGITDPVVGTILNFLKKAQFTWK